MLRDFSALDMVLEDMGLFGVFRSAMAATLGEQAWQLEVGSVFSSSRRALLRPHLTPSFSGSAGIRRLQHEEVS